MSDLTSRRTFLKAGSAAGLLFGSSGARRRAGPETARRGARPVDDRAGAATRAADVAGPHRVDRPDQGRRPVPGACPVHRWRGRHGGGASRRARNDVADPDQEGRAVLCEERRARSRGAARRAVYRGLQLQVAGTAVLGPGRERRNRTSSTCSATSPASRSANCSAPSSGATSPSTAPAATAATARRRSSSISSSWSARSARRPSSSGSARGCDTTMPRRSGTWRSSR